MELNRISGVIVDEAFRLQEQLGPGLLESVYEMLLAHRLSHRGVSVVRQAPIKVQLDGIVFDEGFRIDLLVEDAILVELKSSEQNHPVYSKQLLTYLRVTRKPLGLLINFGLPLFKDGIKRVVNHLPPEQSLLFLRDSASPREPK